VRKQLVDRLRRTDDQKESKFFASDTPVEPEGSLDSPLDLIEPQSTAMEPLRKLSVTKVSPQVSNGQPVMKMEAQDRVTKDKLRKPSTPLASAPSGAQTNSTVLNNPLSLSKLHQFQEAAQQMFAEYGESSVPS